MMGKEMNPAIINTFVGLPQRHPDHKRPPRKTLLGGGKTERDGNGEAPKQSTPFEKDEQRRLRKIKSADNEMYSVLSET